MSTVDHSRSPAKAVRSRRFRGGRSRRRSAAEPVQGAVRIAVLHASLRSPRGASVRGVCLSVGRSGIPVHRPAPRPTRLLRCVAMKTTRLLVLTLVLALCAAHRRRLRLLQRQRRRRRSRRADPGRRPGLPRGRRAPRRQGPQRPRGRAEEDPAHRRPRREDHSSCSTTAARATTSPSRTTSSRGWATASASPSPRCTTAGTPTTSRSSPPRTTARPTRCWPSRRATSSSAPTRASTTASTRKDKTATAIVDHRVVVGTEGGLKAVVDAKGRDHARRGQRPERRPLQGRPGPHRALLPRRPGPAAHRRADRRAATRRSARMLQSFASAAPKTIGAALQAAARRPAHRRGQHRHAEVGDDRRQRRGHPRHAARRLVAGPGRRPTSARRSTASLQTVAGGGGLTGVGVNALLGAVPEADRPGPAPGRARLDGRRRRVRRRDVERRSRRRARHQDDRPRQDQAHDDGPRALRAQQSAGTKITSLHGKGIDDGFTAQGRDRAAPSRSPSPATASWSPSAAQDVLAQAISPSRQLGSSPAFTAAAGKLGNGLRPSFYLDFTQVTKLIESFAGTDAGFQKAKPYLDTFGAVVAGAKDEGSGVTRVALRRDAALDR